MSNLVWADSDSTVILDKCCKVRIICKKFHNDSIKISVQNLSNKSIYLQLGSSYYPARRKDTIIAFIGLRENPLDDIRFYSLSNLKPREVYEIDTDGSKIDYLKLYLTFLLNKKCIKRKFDKESGLYSYKIENLVYHKLKRKYMFLLKV